MVWKYLRALRARSSDDLRPLPYIDPLHAGRHPFQIYMLALCVVSGAPYLFGYATAEAVEKQLPVFLALAWGLMLFFGAAIALVGSYWKGSIANALTMERVGLSSTGGAAVVYGLCIVGTRSLFAPLFMVGLHIGYLLLRVPVSTDRWSPRTARHIEDSMTAVGVLLIIGCVLGLVLSPARVVLVGAFVIVGFGASCLVRSRDIATIFRRANETNSLPILREPKDHQ